MGNVKSNPLVVLLLPECATDVTLVQSTVTAPSEVETAVRRKADIDVVVT